MSVTGSVLRSRDRHVVATGQHPHRQALHHGRVPQQHDLRVWRPHQVHLLLRPVAGLLDTRGTNLLQTGEREYKSPLTAPASGACLTRDVILTGELRHVGVQREDLHPRRQRGERRSHRHHPVLRPGDEHHHEHRGYAAAHLLPRLRDHPPLHWQIPQALTTDAHTWKHTLCLRDQSHSSRFCAYFKVLSVCLSRSSTGARFLLWLVPFLANWLQGLTISQRLNTRFLKTQEPSFN